MGLNEILSKLNLGCVTAGIVILLSLIQISPLKLNPWDKLLGWFGKKLNGATEKRLETVEKQIRDMWINNHRQTVLTFARECRADIEHSSDEWTNVLNVAEEYEKYVIENKITNGIITQDTVYLRKLYQELSREHKI
ncbi:MAG: hypothetical protein BWY83_02362 [bacterium ADurb.Bin478]|nr:MAG: hypothetical protein BWY83_02362 [bacterium ADurb.Bin478]